MSAGFFPFFSGNTSVFFFLYNYCFSPDLSCSFWSLAPALCNRAHCCDQDMIKTHAHTGFGIHWGAVSPAWRLHWDNYTGIHTGSVIRQCHRVQCVHNCVSAFVCFWYRFFVCENKKLVRSLFYVCVCVSQCNTILTWTEGAQCTFNRFWLTQSKNILHESLERNNSSNPKSSPAPSLACHV